MIEKLSMNSTFSNCSKIIARTYRNRFELNNCTLRVDLVRAFIATKIEKL